VFDGMCSKTSQLVLIANLRSLPSIGLQIGAPSKAEEQRRLRAEEDRRWIGFDPGDVLRPDLAPVDAGEDAIQRDHPLERRHRPLDLARDGASLLAADRRE